MIVTYKPPMVVDSDGQAWPMACYWYDFNSVITSELMALCKSYRKTRTSVMAKCRMTIIAREIRRQRHLIGPQPLKFHPTIFNPLL